MDRRTQARIRIAACGVLAVVTAAVSGLGALALALPGHRVPLAPDLSPVHEARAELALNGPEPDHERAIAESRAALALSPMSAHAWGRLAYARSRAGLTPEALSDLERTYAVSPYGPVITGWRLRFLYGYWPALTPDLRRQANAEIRLLARYYPAPAWALASEVHDSPGGVSAAISMALGRHDAEKARAAAPAAP